MTRHLPLLLALSLVLPVPPPDALAAGNARQGGESGAHTAAVESSARAVEARQRELDRLRGEQRRLQRELRRLEGELSQRSAALETLTERLARQRQEYEDKEQELARARQDWQLARQRLQRRLRVLFTRRDNPLLDLAFATSSPVDLVTFSESSQVMLEHDQMLQQRYRRTVSGLESSRQALALEQGVLVDMLLQDETLRDALTEGRRNKEELLAELERQTARQQRALAENEREWRRLLQGMGQEAGGQLPRQAPVTLVDVASLKGRLPPPLAGLLLPPDAADDERPAGKDTEAIVIAAAEGTTVQAIAPGRVLFAGYLAGYGNAVVLDHGGDFSSVTGHLGKILVQREQHLRQGEPLGSCSDIAALVRGGVVLELRRGGRTLPVLEWLRPDAFASASNP